MSSFKSFIVDNGVLSTTAGITIGFATATFVKSFVADVILPIIFLIMVKATGKVSKDTSGFFSRFLSKKEFMFTNFISETITWLLIVLVAFLVLDAVYVHYIKNKPIISQEAMVKPFQVTQEFLKTINPFAPPPQVPVPPPKQPEFFDSQQQVLWGAAD